MLLLVESATCILRTKWAHRRSDFAVVKLSLLSKTKWKIAESESKGSNMYM